MPRYEFECKKCSHRFDIWSLMSQKQTKVKKEKCPECGSKSKSEVLGAPSFTFSNPIGTDRYNNNHDYRFKYAQDRSGGTRDQRKAAEKASHMGTSPYSNIDDISSDKNFGKVK